MSFLFGNYLKGNVHMKKYLADSGGHMGRPRELIGGMGKLKRRPNGIFIAISPILGPKITLQGPKKSEKMLVLIFISQKIPR